ncbi:MAG: hypothetical protein ACR2QJ_01065 [Geminicoccaceae bacterium]
MKIETLLTAIIGLTPLLIGCVDRLDQPGPVLDGSGSHLTILDDDQNLLARKRISARGFTALDIVIRKGQEDDVEGVFVQFNSNTRFVPWVDLMTNPLGQQIPSDSFVRAGKLGLRLAEKPCGRRTPLLIQVRELRAEIREFGTAGTTNTQAAGGHLSLEELTYTTLLEWTESGLHTPEWPVGQVGSHGVDERCRAKLDQAPGSGVGHALDQLGSVTPATSDQRTETTAIAAISWQPADGLPKRQRGYEPDSTQDGNG